MGRGQKSQRKTSKLRTASSKKEPVEQTEIPSWVVEIYGDINEGHKFVAGKSWTIYRVPDNIREVQESAFTPKIISIGPFHREDQKFKAMEEHKMRFLVRLLGGKFDQMEEVRPVRALKLEVLTKAMRSLEYDTRACYSEAFDDRIDSNDFVQMMVVDGCFVVELLRLFDKVEKRRQEGNGDQEKESNDDPIFATCWMLRTLQRDLLMLENQLPYFVLQKLFELTRMDETEDSLADLAAKFFNQLLPRDDYKSNESRHEEFDHLLDHFRSTFLSKVRKRAQEDGWKTPSKLPDSQHHGISHLRKLLSIVSLYKRQDQSSNNSSSTKPTSVRGKDQQLLNRALELEEAGVRFNKQSRSELLDITFTDGVLNIPPLLIDDNTVLLFLNFVAFEQCDKDAKPFFTNYFIFLDGLIYSKVDMQILHKNGIIDHALGSNRDVAALINKLGREIVYDQDKCYLYREMNGINDHCKGYYKSWWRSSWRKLLNDYFSNPWSFLSLLAAIALLVLTFLQTYYTMNPIS